MILRNALPYLLILVPSLLAGQTPTPAPGAPPDSVRATPGTHQENLFAGFATHVLENGLRVWFRRIPGAANTSVAVSIPYGWDMDPTYVTVTSLRPP